jgi:hypothetical protein
MAVSNATTSFNDLSQELQDTIWSYALGPRVISLTCFKCLSTNHPIVATDPQGYHPVHLPPGSRCAHLYDNDIRSPIALSVCRASRQIAQTKGYRTWKLIRSDLKVKLLVWNPIIDIVFFPGIDRNYFNLFVKYLFPLAKEIQRLAFSHSFWKESYGLREHNGGRGRRVSRGLSHMLNDGHSSLEVYFIIADKEFFATGVEGKSVDDLEFWNAPWGIAKGFPGFWIDWTNSRNNTPEKPAPSIRIVWNFKMILDGAASNSLSVRHYLEL